MPPKTDPDEEFRRISQNCDHAPGPQGEGFPAWAGDGVIEDLPQFFDGTAHVWDARFAANYRFLHQAVADQIPCTDAPLTILDVGCGTGLELEYIFQRAPNARITGMDQAPRMLTELWRKYTKRTGQIDLVQCSCLDWPADLKDFDYALSILTLHHFPPKTKPGIYADIRSALKDGGHYIEGDQMVEPEVAAENLKLFNAWIAKLPGGEQGQWNYDVRLSVEANRQLVLDAGFLDCNKAWDDDDESSDGHAVLVATK
jgi:tRNA (cmo5U34)-methyltransferase